MGLDTEVWDVSWIVGVPWLMWVSAGYFICKARYRRRLAAAAEHTRGAA